MTIKLTDIEGKEYEFKISLWDCMKIFIAGYFGWFLLLLFGFGIIWIFTTL